LDDVGDVWGGWQRYLTHIHMDVLVGCILLPLVCNVEKAKQEARDEKKSERR